MAKEPKVITEPFGFSGGQILEDLLDKDPSGITSLEKDILKARRSYLTDEQIEKFGLNEPEPEPEPIKEPEPKEVEVLAKRGRPSKK